MTKEGGATGKPWALLALLLLTIAPPPAQAGELWATFHSRLSCRYSSFAVAEVKTVHRSSIDVAFTGNLLRRPPGKTARIRFSPKCDHYAPGEKLLINAWHFPGGSMRHWPTGPDRSFPGSFYHGRRNECWVLARIGTDGKLSAIYTELGPILDWLYSTGNWDVRISETKVGQDGGQVFVIVFPNGRQETLTFPVGARGWSRNPVRQAGKPPRE